MSSWSLLQEFKDQFLYKYLGGMTSIDQDEFTF